MTVKFKIYFTQIYTFVLSFLSFIRIEFRYSASKTGDQRLDSNSSTLFLKDKYSFSDVISKLTEYQLFRNYSSHKHDHRKKFEFSTPNHVEIIPLVMNTSLSSKRRIVLFYTHTHKKNKKFFYFSFPTTIFQNQELFSCMKRFNF